MLRSIMIKMIMMMKMMMIRPLRMVTKFPSVQLIVTSAFGIIPKLYGLALVSSLFILIFAILGVSFFGGGLLQCMDSDGTAIVLDASTYIGENVTRVMETCHSLNYTWGNNPYIGSFDSVPQAMLLLFETATGEMWPNIMAAFVDSVPPGHAPQTNYSTGSASCFFVAFMIVGSLFTLSLFVGAITDQFNQKADSLANAGGTTDLQKEYLWVYRYVCLYVCLYKGVFMHREVTKLDVTTSTRCFVQGLFSYGEDKPENYNQQWDVRFRYHCYKLISHKYFHYAGSVISVLSLILIASWNGNASESYLFFFRTTDLVFSWLFLMEVALKVLGLGWHQYWYFGANKIDFVLAILAMPVAIGSLATSFFDPKIPRLNGLRALRLERLLRGELRAMVITITREHERSANGDAFTRIAHLIQLDETRNISISQSPF
jgi:hypothetical protein